MRYRKGMLAGAMLALLPLLASTTANAQKQRGTLRIFHRDSPANMSIHEEGTISVVAPLQDQLDAVAPGYRVEQPPPWPFPRVRVPQLSARRAV